MHYIKQLTFLSCLMAAPALQAMAKDPDKPLPPLMAAKISEDQPSTWNVTTALGGVSSSWGAQKLFETVTSARNSTFVTGLCAFGLTAVSGLSRYSKTFRENVAKPVGYVQTYLGNLRKKDTKTLVYTGAAATTLLAIYYRNEIGTAASSLIRSAKPGSGRNPGGIAPSAAPIVGQLSVLAPSENEIQVRLEQQARVAREAQLEAKLKEQGTLLIQQQEQFIQQREQFIQQQERLVALEQLLRSVQIAHQQQHQASSDTVVDLRRNTESDLQLQLADLRSDLTRRIHNVNHDVQDQCENVKEEVLSKMKAARKDQEAQIEELSERVRHQAKLGTRDVQIQLQSVHEDVQRQANAIRHVETELADLTEDVTDQARAIRRLQEERQGAYEGSLDQSNAGRDDEGAALLQELLQGTNRAQDDAFYSEEERSIEE